MNGRRFLVPATAALLAALGSGARGEPPEQASDRSALFRKALEEHGGSVALVSVRVGEVARGRRPARRGRSTTAAAWLLRRKGLLVTGLPALVASEGRREQAASPVFVTPPDGGEAIEAELAAIRAELGLAFLRVPEKKAQKRFPGGPFRLEESGEARIGERVFWIERIGAADRSFAIVRSGIVAGRTPKPARRLVVDARVPPGAVVFSMRGLPVGVAVAAPEAGSGGVGLGYVLPGAQAREVVRQVAQAGPEPGGSERGDF